MMNGGAGTSPEKVFAKVSAENGLVKIPVSAIGNASTAYFAYAVGDKEVKFFALKSVDGSLRVALDACNACYRAKLGYHRQGDSMICNNCGMAFRSQDIGVQHGGCNPIPVEKRTEGDMIVLNARDLEDGAKFF